MRKIVPYNKVVWQSGLTLNRSEQLQYLMNDAMYKGGWAPRISEQYLRDVYKSDGVVEINELMNEDVMFLRCLFRGDGYRSIVRYIHYICMSKGDVILTMFLIKKGFITIIEIEDALYNISTGRGLQDNTNKSVGSGEVPSLPV